MTNVNSGEQIKNVPTPQEELENIWNNPDNWRDGMPLSIEGLPEGMQAIEFPQDESVILRSVMPGLPERVNKKPIRNVPVAVFYRNAIRPENILSEAVKLTQRILAQEVKFVPPKFKDMAA